MTLSIQLGPKQRFLPVSLRTFKHGNNAYVGFIAAHKPVTLYGNRKTLITALRTLADELEGNITPPQYRPRPNAEALNWDWLSPRFVVDYLYASYDPGLREMAPELEALLCPEIQGGLKQDLKTVLKKLDPIQLFELDGQPVWGAQKQVAEALCISNGGAHRKRILPVLDSLKNKYLKHRRSGGVGGSSPQPSSIPEQSHNERKAA